MRCPQQVAAAIRLLEEQGFEAYAVGGCVRDSLLGLTPPYTAALLGGLLHGGNEIAGETLLLVITFIQRVPADIVFACRPLGNEGGLSVARRTRDQRQPEVVRAGKFSQQALTNHGMVESHRTT